MNKIKLQLLIESKKKNRYLYDGKKGTVTLCHPVFFDILSQPPQSRESIREGESREDFLQWQYYYQKYLLFKANGHFEAIDQKERLSARMTAAEVGESLANVTQVAFETTDRCNLDCKYCGYGEFYGNYDQRETKEMEPASAKKLLDYLKKQWNSPLNISHDRMVNFSFYGGEPLMNFSFIKEITRYARQMDLHHNRVTFSMTTNALLLEKYMDFLVQQDFRILISLDGDHSNNQYRVLKNGEPAYDLILRNLTALRLRYPDYFKANVSFNAVLHNKNSVDGLFEFFKRQFDKIPRISPLNTSGVKESQKEVFGEMYANTGDRLRQSEDYSMQEREMFTREPGMRDVALFLSNSGDSTFSDYNDLLYSSPDTPRCPTGTCSPFSKKVFLTVNNKILACERIGQYHVLGYVTGDNVEIDCQQIAEKYNQWYDNIRKQCHNCYNTERCTQCIFYLDLSQGKPRCNGFMNQKEYSAYLGAYLDFIERKPHVYSPMIKEVVID